MRIGASLFLIAVGAIMRFAINTNNHNTHGFNVGVAGVILMIVGAIGLIASVIWMTSRRRTDVITHGPGGTRATTYVEPADPIAGPY
jgi:membrane-bound ClpP family serine protease